MYVAYGPAAVITGSTVAALPSADLKNKNNVADYIVIAPEELKDAAQLLAAYRQSTHMTTMVVSLENIMDEFNFGMSAPRAIKSFLQYAYTKWKKKPTYAVLLGNGSFDYKNIEGFGGNLLPPLMVGTPMGLMPSDSVLGDFNGDNVPEIGIGRIPIMTSAELQPVIDKIRSFETAKSSGIILLADLPDGAGNFPKDSNDIASIFPTNYPVQNLSGYPPDQARGLFFDGLTKGASFVNYLGHASFDQLSDEDLLSIPDIGNLNNTVYPIMTALTCSAGHFALPGYDSLMELLVLQNGGGMVSSWSPSGWSYNWDAKLLGQGFYNAVFQPNVLTLSDAVISSMSAYRATGNYPFMLNIMNILGDPALRLK